MRGVVVAMLSLGLAQPALAADLGILRGSSGFGPPVYRNWEGLYVGGQVGVGGGGANFGGEGQALVGTLIAHTFMESAGVGDWDTAGKADTGHAAQYGAFIGYNGQWDDVVIGLEANYYHTNLSAAASGSTGPIWLPNNNYNFAVSASATSYISLSDFGTVRARAGWAFERFLPYLTAGVALGRASYGTTATVGYPLPVYTGDPTKPPQPPNPGAWSGTTSDGKTNALIYGWSAGLGIDIALTNNIFLRGEYEFIQFSQMRLNLNNARVGAGIRF